MPFKGDGIQRHGCSLPAYKLIHVNVGFVNDAGAVGEAARDSLIDVSIYDSGNIDKEQNVLLPLFRGYGKCRPLYRSWVCFIHKAF